MWSVVVRVAPKKKPNAYFETLLFVMAEAPFTGKPLDTPELTTAIRTHVDQNAHLDPEKDPQLIARMYEKFRFRVGPMLAEEDWDDISVFVWIDVIGDMMTVARKWKSVPGGRKKQILLEVIDLVIESECPPERHAMLRKVVRTTVAPAIDLAAYYVTQIKPGCKKLCKKLPSSLQCCRE